MSRVLLMIALALSLTKVAAQTTGSGPRGPIEVQVGMSADNGLSGLWFQPDAPGDGFNVVVTPNGTVVYYYGTSDDGKPVWYVSDNLPPLKVGSDSSVELFAPETVGIRPVGPLRVAVGDCNEVTFQHPLIHDGSPVQSRQLASVNGGQCVRGRMEPIVRSCDDQIAVVDLRPERLLPGLRVFEPVLRQPSTDLSNYVIQLPAEFILIDDSVNRIRHLQRFFIDSESEHCLPGPFEIELNLDVPHPNPTQQAYEGIVRWDKPDDASQQLSIIAGEPDGPLVHTTGNLANTLTTGTWMRDGTRLYLRETGSDRIWASDVGRMEGRKVRTNYEGQITFVNDLAVKTVFAGEESTIQLLMVDSRVSEYRSRAEFDDGLLEITLWSYPDVKSARREALIDIEVPEMPVGRHLLQVKINPEEDLFQGNFRTPIRFQQTIDVSASAAPLDLAGLWYDPSAPGEGIAVIPTQSGTVFVYYGLNDDGQAVWSVSDNLVGDFEYGSSVGQGLFRSDGEGSVRVGSLQATFNDCRTATFVITGEVERTLQAIQLAGIDGLECLR